MNALLGYCSGNCPKFEIATVQELGWTGIKNGELLRLAENDFDVFITSDKNLRYQQNLAISPLSSCPLIKFQSSPY